ncbi:hypothetical protein TNCV_1971072 [Trichonephila clavipes]|uniref:Uncharacterized protein n=1 Tax=Trichonephila clavipes TaxID=2585209 RepID=A0A8X6W579_TRICX|nr:hypothetical protein TNCV_1971072 [Trichonephila clavipes]
MTGPGRPGQLRAEPTGQLRGDLSSLNRRQHLIAPTHLMILIPAKMNSTDYDDFIEMFTVPTPISPLTPTPVAFPSHEPSQDVIYDSLPPMEQSKVPE